MAKRGCSIGALSRGSKIALGVGAVVLAVGAGYVVYRATKNNGQGTQTMFEPNRFAPGPMTLEAGAGSGGQPPPAQAGFGGGGQAPMPSVPGYDPHGQTSW
jgi:hypothetical protein